MKPEDIIAPLLKHYTLPKSVVEFLYYQLLYEAKWNEKETGVGIALALSHLFSKLPKVRDVDDSSFFAPIKALADLLPEDYFALANC